MQKAKKTKLSDPVIDRIRATRHEISERFGHDTAKLVEHYIELQKQYQDQLVDTAPEVKRPGKSSAA
jgi:hypothetical protein